MRPEQRRRHIVELMNLQEGANVPVLAHQFGVSDATIRRDLIQLQARGALKRTPCGAVAGQASTAFEPLYAHKSRSRRELKDGIGARACRLVDDGEVVVLDSGSTTLALARQLKDEHQGLAVITCDLVISLERSEVPSFEVLIVGGTVRRGLNSVVGALSEEMLTTLYANHAFLSADAISVTAEITNANLAEVAVKRRLGACSAPPVLLADHHEFGRVSLPHVAPGGALSEIITDEGTSAAAARSYREARANLPVVALEGRP